MTRTSAGARARALILTATLAGLSACASAPSDPRAPRALFTADVKPSAETAPVSGAGDAADDPAILVGLDGGALRILATDKTETGGLYLYDERGVELQFVPGGRLNNVDVRERVDFEGFPRTLAAATDRTRGAIQIYEIDVAAARVRPESMLTIPLDVSDPYGVCLGALGDGRVFVAATGKNGEFRQYRLIAGKDDGVEAQEARRFTFASQVEGCVIDDRTGHVYVGEEDSGIWRFSVEPATGDAKDMVARVDGTTLVADVEGLAIYPEGAAGGYLVASSQGDSAYSVYALPGMGLVGRFRIVADPERGLDAVSDTDGVAITARGTSGYPAGVLVVQDGADDRGRQNYKIIDWRAVREALVIP